MRALYVSHNGMAENLGQSQVLPYLRGLSRRGVAIDLVSFELPTLTGARRDEIAHDLARDAIRWHPLSRRMGGPLREKVLEAGRGASLALRTALQRRPDIVHGRSYFPTAVCDLVSQVGRGARLLFDCRGMLGDEYVDCGHWTPDRIEYRLVKRYERRLFARADGIVVLTRALQRWLIDTGAIGTRPKVSVIPCCVDLEKFRPDEASRDRLRKELGLGDAFTILYSGSLGTWYLEDEMARFANVARERIAASGRKTVFVCLTPSDATGLRAKLQGLGFPESDIIVRRVPPSAMPQYLCIGDVGLSFIQSCFSKKGSSPTKVAEYLACGNVAVVNGDIGDQADLADERDACVVLESFSDDAIEKAVVLAVALADRPRELRTSRTLDVARRHFSLTLGVSRYADLYQSLVV